MHPYLFCILFLLSCGVVGALFWGSICAIIYIIEQFFVNPNMQFAASFCYTRARWLADAARHAVYPDTYARVQRCSTGIGYNGPAMHRGIVVFLHGVNACWWQWRNVATAAMEHPDLREYAFYVPTILARGNTDPETAAREIADLVHMAISQLDHPIPIAFDVVLVGTSMGARIGAHVEVMLAEKLGERSEWVRRFVFVSVAGFFGPTPNAQLAHRIGLPLTWLGYHESVAAAATSQAPHDKLIAAWQDARAVWTTAYYHFYASEQDEVITPVAASLPWPADPPEHDGPRTEHTVVTGADHSGMVEEVADEYIAWIVDVLAE